MPGLDAQFAHLVVDFGEAYAREAAAVGAPSLVQWSNFLRLMPDHAIRPDDIAIAANLSRRVIKSRRGMPEDWIEIISDPSGKPIWCLTDSGRQARVAGSSLVASTEAAWCRALGAASSKALRRAAERFVSALEIELSWYPMTYGPADRSSAGGSSVAAKPGPPRVPAHGTDWKPVIRATDNDTVSDVPLYALLSQGYTAFQVDYEQLAGYPKPSVDSIVNSFTKERMALASLPPGLGIDGSGRPPLERHGIVQVDLHMKEAVLTAQGRALVEHHEERLRAIVSDWRDRYGVSVIDDLQAALAATSAKLPEDLPDHVFVWQWSDLSRLGR